MEHGFVPRRCGHAAGDSWPVLHARRARSRVTAASTINSKAWLVPCELLRGSVDPAAMPAEPATVYTVRVSTSARRGGALSDPMAGVNICLIGKDKRAVLHRVSPVNDPGEHQALMRRICEVVSPDMGANCEVIAPDAAAPILPPGKPSGPRARFTEGCVDEVCLLAPELGPLAALMLAPEGGSWVPDEVNVVSSRTGHSDRFVCRQRLGGRDGDPAVYLTPVPPGAVVYGSGDGAVILTQEQASALRRASMSSYSELKQRLLLATALLTAGGSGIAAAACGAYAAVPFAVGGAAGLVYQFLLQVGADAVLDSSARGAVPAAAQAADATLHEQDAAPGVVQRMLSSPAVRVASIALLALLAVVATQAPPSALDGGNAVTGAVAAEDPLAALRLRGTDAWQLGVALLGFMMYKVAVVGVSLAPGGDISGLEPAVRQYQRNGGA